MDYVSELIRVMREVSRMDSLSLSELSRVLAVEFPPPELLPGGVLERTVYPLEGLFGMIVLKENAQVSSMSWLLGLEMASHVHVAESELRLRIPKLSAPSEINPRVPPEGTVTFEINECHQTTYFVFRARSRVLYRCAVHRPADGRMPSVQDPW